MPAYAIPQRLDNLIFDSLTDAVALDSNPIDLNRPSKTNIIIVGAGMAGSRLAIKLVTAIKELSAEDSTPFQNLSITLISKEPQVGYNRIMLSPVLAGEKSFEDTYLYTDEMYQQLGISVLSGVSVESIDTTSQCVFLDNNQTLNYTHLVLATGSTARVIPFPNHGAKGVHVFRDVADVEALTAYAKQGKKGLVIGGGVLGLEAACALSAQGADMTVIHVDDYVLNRQLDLPAALMLQDELAKRNVGLELSAATSSIEVNALNEVVGLSFKDGRTVPADFVVMAVGIIPQTTLASENGIDVNRGIIVDEYMHTSANNVYAIGECVEINDELFGMVSSVNQHVDSLISVLLNPKAPDKLAESTQSGLDLINQTQIMGLDPIKSSQSNRHNTNINNPATNQDNKHQWLPFVSVPLSLKLKVSGVAVFSAGQIEFDESQLYTPSSLLSSKDNSSDLLVERIVYRNVQSEHYQCLYIQDNRLIGVVLYGETSDGNYYSQLINEQTDISSFKDDLIYGVAYCDSIEPTEFGKQSEPDESNLNRPALALSNDDSQTSNGDIGQSMVAALSNDLNKRGASLKVNAPAQTV